MENLTVESLRAFFYTWLLNTFFLWGVVVMVAAGVWETSRNWSKLGSWAVAVSTSALLVTLFLFLSLAWNQPDQRLLMEVVDGSFSMLFAVVLVTLYSWPLVLLDGSAIWFGFQVVALMVVVYWILRTIRGRTGLPYRQYLGIVTVPVIVLSMVFTAFYTVARLIR